MRSLASVLVIFSAAAALISFGAWAQATQSPFVGKWSGYWGGQNASTLEVDSVSEAGKARGVYTFKGESSKFRAKVKDAVLSWGDPDNGIGFEFTLQPDGKLHGERYDHGGQAGDIMMTKM